MSVGCSLCLVNQFVLDVCCIEYQVIFVGWNISATSVVFNGRRRKRVYQIKFEFRNNCDSGSETSDYTGYILTE
jgi:hypothetical protein